MTNTDKDQPAPDTVLVTGGTGFIGTHLIDALINRGENVTVIDNLSTSALKYLHPDAEFINQDIRDSNVTQLVKDLNPKTV